MLEDRNDELADRVDGPGTDAEIERLAREQYHLVYPGEEAYALLPAAAAAARPVPDAWPFRASAAGDAAAEVAASPDRLPLIGSGRPRVAAA